MRREGALLADTDDLVLVNSNMSIVLGTYGRRGDGQETAGTVEKKGE